jgi:phage-related baseplate assembly protein
MSRFAATTIDLSQLPAPDIIDALSYAAIRQALIDDFLARHPAYDLASLEVDPAVKILEVAAYRELILRALINDKARAVLLASARGSDLDQLGVYYGVSRLTIATATESLPAALESDDDLRRRIQLAPEAFSVAGPKGAYEFHALSADALIKSVGVYAYGDAGLAPGEVRLYLLTRTGDGLASSALIDKVRGYLKDGQDRVPATDIISVLPATIAGYAVSAALLIPPGPDPALVKQRAEAAARSYAATRHAVGLSVPRSGLIRALMVDAVENVILTSPTADIPATLGAAPFCTSIALTTEAAV